MKVLCMWNKTKNALILHEVLLRESLIEKSRGLLPFRELDSETGMLLTGCRHIHTIGMHFPIDCVFLNKQLKVVAIKPDIRPHRLVFGPLFDCDSVLEMNAGKARIKHIEIGDELVLKEKGT